MPLTISSPFKKAQVKNFKVAIVASASLAACGTMTEVPMMMGQLAGPAWSLSISSKFALLFQERLVSDEAKLNADGATKRPSR